MRIPRSWECKRHVLPTEYGCVHCDPIIAILRTMRGPRRALALELVLMYAADDLRGSVQGTSEFRRARKHLAEAARAFAAVTTQRLRRSA